MLQLQISILMFTKKSRFIKNVVTIFHAQICKVLLYHLFSSSINFLYYFQKLKLIKRFSHHIAVAIKKQLFSTTINVLN